MVHYFATPEFPDYCGKESERIEEIKGKGFESRNGCRGCGFYGCFGNVHYNPTRSDKEQARVIEWENKFPDSTNQPKTSLKSG